MLINFARTRLKSHLKLQGWVVNTDTMCVDATDTKTESKFTFEGVNTTLKSAYTITLVLFQHPIYDINVDHFFGI